MWQQAPLFNERVEKVLTRYKRLNAVHGEVYTNFGSTANVDFTGDTQDTIAGTYDAENREQNPNQGRWLSLDPAGLNAVNLTNPQTWNRYAYVLNNPLSSIDPSGFWCVWEDNSHGMTRETEALTNADAKHRVATGTRSTRSPESSQTTTVT
jgi:RHS repeat-associated protein